MSGAQDTQISNVSCKMSVDVTDLKQIWTARQLALALELLLLTL